MRAQIVSFHCVLRDQVGNFISSTYNHDVITQVEGSDGGLLRGLVQGLREIKAGEKRRITLSAHEAYGFYDTALVFEVPRKDLLRGPELQIGHELLTQAEDGERRTFRVVRADKTSVTLDGNHPLAGRDLCFDIEATSARDATHEEIFDSASERPKRQLH